MSVSAKRKTMLPGKVSQAKRYDYLKKIEVDGYPRIRAYAEAIDPKIYDLSPEEITNRLNYLKEAWKDYDDLRDMIRAEQNDWTLRRSVIAQDKAMELLTATLDKATDLVKKEDCDMKEFMAAVNTLKTIMPALSRKEEAPAQVRSAKSNAARFIN